MTVVAELEHHLQAVTEWLQDKPLTTDLADQLATAFPAHGDWCQTIKALCQQGLGNGEVGPREAPNIRYGRVLKPDAKWQNFSLDVVLMTDLKGPHHSHPNGEIDLIFPCDPDARFDGHGEGWLVYEPGTAHHPTVTGGQAIVVYLLPDGAIEFTRH